MAPETQAVSRRWYLGAAALVSARTRYDRAGAYQRLAQIRLVTWRSVVAGKLRLRGGLRHHRVERSVSFLHAGSITFSITGW